MPESIGLLQTESQIIKRGTVTQDGTTDLVILGTLVSTLVESNSFSPLIVIRSLEFVAPLLDNVCHSLEENAFYPLVQLRYPMIEVRIALQVQSIDLRRNSEGTGIRQNVGVLTAA